MIQSVTYLSEVAQEELFLNEFLEQWFSSNDTISIQTSGSTGSPKFIELKKEHMLISARSTLDYFAIQKGGNALLCLPLNSIGGIMMVVRAIEGNLNLIVTPVKANPLEDWDKDVSIDIAAMVPTQLNQVVKKNAHVLKSIRTLLIGGAPVSHQLIRDLKSLEYTAYQTFGMTETISHIAVRKIGENTEDTYVALPTVTFSEINGELVIHYPKISPKPIQTKEHIELIDALHFKWLGRTDLVINSGGKKVFPEKIEHYLENLISQPFIVAGLPDEYWGEMVVLILSGNKFNLTKNKLKESNLAAYELPKRIYYVDNIIYLPSGKINRNATVKQLNRDEYSELL